MCGPAFNDASSYRAAEAPIGWEVQREVLSTMVPDEIVRGEAVVIAGDSPLEFGAVLRYRFEIRRGSANIPTGLGCAGLV